ncbi:MAG: hypothetical protein NVS3B10_17920 [Polyangiales bacterium]
MKASDSDLRARFPNDQGYVASIRKRAVRLEAKPASDAAIALGDSRLGGSPDLPQGAAWPMRGDQALPFVAQLRLEDVAAFDEDALLPHEGWLLFFVDAAARAARVLHLAGGAALVRLRMPEGGRVFTPCAVGLSAIDSFPVPPSPFVDVESISKKGRAQWDALLAEQAHDVAPGKAHQLLGYPTRGDDAGDFDGDTRLLLQLDADPAVGLDAALLLTAKDADLRRAEFSRVKVR